MSNKTANYGLPQWNSMREEANEALVKIDEALTEKADKSEVYTKDEVDTKLETCTGSPDGSYSKDEVNILLSKKVNAGTPTRITLLLVQQIPAGGVYYWKNELNQVTISITLYAADGVLYAHDATIATMPSGFHPTVQTFTTFYSDYPIPQAYGLRVDIDGRISAIMPNGISAKNIYATLSYYTG